jgi:predicted ATPase
MFKRVTLGNFKRFQQASLNLRRVNVIVGPNNSGKSSVIGAIRLLCQTLDSYDDQVPLLLNGPFGDFGTYRDVVYKNHRGRPLELAFDIEVPNLASVSNNVTGEKTRVSFDVVFKYRQEQREIYAQSITVKIDGNHAISLKYSVDGRRHNVEKLGSVDIPSALKNSISREFRVRHFLPVPFASRLGLFADSDRDTPYKKFVAEFNSSKDSDVVRNLARLNTRVTRFISKTDYLGPLRTPPARTYLFSGERSKRIGASGENMTSLLATTESKRARERADNSDDPTIGEQINSWLQKAQMAQSATVSPISDRHFELRIKNFFTKEDQNIADVGYGHSQVIPFLAGGYALGSGAVYMTEQPELHLHPKAQAELGDFVTELYQAETQVIIETHSEHMILRLQQHVANGNISPRHIRFFYVTNDPEVLAKEDASLAQSSEIIPIDLDGQGQFTTPWPRGFFPEKLEESKKLAKIRMAQLQLKF